MAEILLFRLYAPLASFGTVAVGEQRPSQTHPGKSLIVGLLGAALGIRRDEEARLAGLSSAYGLAVLQLRPGQLLRDYHTAQVPSQTDLKKAPHFTRRDELRAAPRSELNTILSARDYRSEALHVIAVWRRADSTETPTLPELATALERPRFTLYVGRKSCPLAFPLAPQIVDAPDLLSAFKVELTDFSSRWQIVSSGPGFDRRLLPQRLGIGRLLGTDPAWLFWEDGDAADPPSGLETLQTHTRNDASLSRKRWQFGPRLEQMAAWPKAELSA
ncbi:MAG: CRISPR-associated protein Cas5/CasD, subtype [Hydrocarboniphaga sp.]|uniref:type I-E CRISPR-associated protein Cas5/CasD n=1 Tax=Hydrocarboniphaga sp. TaxID=2033016 RepID=UPI00261911AF|nr:type I-E CRISPR-associated protein Cas5/CasD [Hydrocarboniphaga sp.]MDB5969447.1 CRISPR-associated protein Cas5/CasD, subtype [Hydrocarboniphaga sp.]